MKKPRGRATRDLDRLSPSSSHRSFGDPLVEGARSAHGTNTAPSSSNGRSPLRGLAPDGFEDPPSIPRRRVAVPPRQAIVEMWRWGSGESWVGRGWDLGRVLFVDARRRGVPLPEPRFVGMSPADALRPTWLPRQSRSLRSGDRSCGTGRHDRPSRGATPAQPRRTVPAGGISTNLERPGRLGGRAASRAGPPPERVRPGRVRTGTRPGTGRDQAGCGPGGRGTGRV